MANDVIFQHLMRHMYPYYYVKYHSFHADVEPFVPKGPLTENLFDIIGKSMYVLEDFLSFPWVEGLKNYDSESLKDFERYILHVMMFCMQKKSIIKDIYERFINVCALVTVIGVHTYSTTRKKFYKLTPRILTEFFEKALKEDFKKRGGWKRLEKYIMDQDYLKYYDICYAAKKSTDKKIAEELNEKRAEFSSRRNHVFSPFPRLEYPIEAFVTSLALEVVSSIEAPLQTELRTSTLKARPSSLEEELISTIQELSLKENFGQNSEASGGDKRDQSFNPCLENHILNLRKLVGESSSNAENSSSGNYLSTGLINLIIGLRSLKLKLQHTILLLQAISVELN